MRLPLPPPLHAAQVERPEPRQDAQPSPSPDQRVHAHSVSPVPWHTGHTSPCGGESAGLGQGGAGAAVGWGRTSSFGASSAPHSCHAAAAASPTPHSSSCPSHAALAACSWSPPEPPTKLAEARAGRGGHGRLRLAPALLRRSAGRPRHTCLLVECIEKQAVSCDKTKSNTKPESARVASPEVRVYQMRARARIFSRISNNAPRARTRPPLVPDVTAGLRGTARACLCLWRVSASTGAAL